VDHAIWGLDPFGYLLGNVVLHALDAGLFLLACAALLRLRAARRAAEGRATALAGGRALAAAALAAAFWAVHPLRVESIAAVAASRASPARAGGPRCSRRGPSSS
jgi:hypothetical protein